MAGTSQKGISDIAKQALLMPQEALLAVNKKKDNLYIGIPKEISYQENRIVLTPQSVALLVLNGHEVVLESGAGNAANFPDDGYSEAGARIVYDIREVYQADLIIKVAPPTPEEIVLMKHGQTLISAIHIASLKDTFLKALMEKKITAISFEYLQDEGGILTVVRSMSEIVGATSILIAAEYLSNVSHGKGLMLGGISGIPPSEVVIIGSGTVGEFAARTALGLGAEVKVFDNSLYKLRRLQNNIGTRIFTSVIQPIVLRKALATCDVAVGAMRAEAERSPCIVSEEMVSTMKSGSVIIDVSIDQGGCFETSQVTNHTKPVFKKHDVIHYCVPNIASRVSRTASYALTNIFTPILLKIGETGGVKNMLWENTGVRSGVYVYRGHLTNKYLSNAFNLPYKDLDLLVAAQA